MNRMAVSDEILPGRPVPTAVRFESDVELGFEFVLGAAAEDAITQPTPETLPDAG